MKLTRNLKIIILVVVIVVVILVAIGLYFLLRPNPYCDPSLCKKGVKHIGCYGNNWGSQCKSPETIKFTSDLIKYTVDLHNKYRNEVAEGGLNSKGGSLPMAERMGVLSWNDDLAYLAKLNTYQCEMKHDKCRNTKQFKFSGQNLGYHTYSNLKPKDIIHTLIKSWFEEYKDINKLDELDKFTGTENGIGHFTALANELQTDVGCGITTSITNHGPALFLACNYSYTNMVGKPVYRKSGSGPCHGCKKGCHPKYKYLCAEGEDIKY